MRGDSFGTPDAVTARRQQWDADIRPDVAPNGLLNTDAHLKELFSSPICA
jgi:hypothetical protein